MERDAVVLAAVEVGVVAPHVDVAAELGSHEEALEQAVHVAGGALVRQAHELALALHLFVLRTHRVRLNTYLDSGHLRLMVGSREKPVPHHPNGSSLILD